MLIKPPQPKGKLDTVTVNGPEDVPDWDAIDWRVHGGNVGRLRRRIFKATREMFDLDGGLGGALGVEAHLDLAGVRGVGVELPAAVDLPGEHDALRRLPGQHAA